MNFQSQLHRVLPGIIQFIRALIYFTISKEYNFGVILKMPVNPSLPINTVISRDEIHNAHPVAVAHDLFARSTIRKNWAPSIAELLNANNKHLSNYTMFLAPLICFGNPDCRIMLRGEKIPGNFSYLERHRQTTLGGVNLRAEIC